jgi:hypothetical protein
VGLHFLSALASDMIHGAGEDAARIVGHLAARRTGDASAPVTLRAVG